ncbi:MAG: sugar phosphate isomerase/epimerase family protein [Phycisphaerales bacterium]
MLPPLSVSLAGLDREADRPWSAGARAAIEWAAELGFRRVQLDATAPGVRPRELDRSGRRDLAALLRRLGLSLSGIDLLIPSADFADPARGELAMSATLGAIEMAAEMATLAGQAGGGRVSIVLPANAREETLAAVRDQASACGVLVADLALPPRETSHEGDPIGVGLDPAALLLSGADPAAAASRGGRRIVAARLTDADAAARVAPGSRGGRLDRLAYVAALEAAGYRGPLVLDLRGLKDQDRAARDVIGSWGDATA